MIPVHLVTGFLGAGKTSFLNRLLRLAELSGTLVVVNEFGEAALDHRLYEKLDGEVSLVGAGCLCCSLRGDFVDGLLALLARRDIGELKFRRIVVETSGLADPGPVLHALFADATLARRLRLANVTTLVDAVNGLDTLERHGEARRQAELADRLALTKTDLADASAVSAMLGRIAPLAPIVEAAEIDGAEFLREIPRAFQRYSPRASHGSARARSFRSERPIDPVGFAHFLTLLGEFAGPRLLRVKGLVATADDPGRPWLVQGAQHVFAPPLRLEGWPEGARETSLVVIGEGAMDTAQRLWGALTGVVAPDAPDWQAVAENPLAPRWGGLLG